MILNLETNRTQFGISFMPIFVLGYYNNFGLDINLYNNQILRINNWLEHWTERTSKIDYSKPHIKIIKGAVEEHLIGFWKIQFCMSYWEGMTILGSPKYMVHKCQFTVQAFN